MGIYKQELPPFPPLPLLPLNTHLTFSTASTTEDDDPSTPICTLLDRAHTCLRMAYAFYNFGRRDAALREYKRGSLVIIELVPRHREEYGSLRNGKGNSGRLYVALKDVVQATSAAFEGVEEGI